MEVKVSMKNKTTDSYLKRNSTKIADVDLYIDGFEIPKNKEITFLFEI